ncbi:MAG: thioredoxin family protein [Myxococcota bacterium]
MVWCLLIVSAWVDAWAAEEASAPPPPAPSVDFQALPETAAYRLTQPDGSPHPVLARLLLDRTALAPGETARIGIHLTQDEGWHTYWKSPGDVGKPTEIAYTVPPGLSVTPHTYPVPQRFSAEGLISFGYDKQVLLTSELKVPDDASPGEIQIAAEADWLVCKTSCIPGRASLTLPVSIVAEGTDTSPSPYAGLFDHYEAQHPATSPSTIDFESALSVEQVPADGSFRAVFAISATDGHTLSQPPESLWPSFTPIVATDFSWGVDPDGVRFEVLEDGRWLVSIDGTGYGPEPLPTHAVVGGLVQAEVDGEWVRTEVTMPLPFAAAGSEAKATRHPLLSLVSDKPVAADGPAPPEEGPAEVVEAGTMTPPPPANSLSMVTLVTNILFGIIGGLILNFMPCVLPVLTLKLYGLVEQVDITNRERRVAAWAYTGGILLSFWAMAAAVIVLQVSFGQTVNWGFLFTYPPYVATLTTVVFAFALSLFGVFEIPALGTGAASDAASKEGPAGYFAYGVFAVLLATPCSAPFLGSAVAYALQASPIEIAAIFTSIGIGLAAPFLIIGYVPRLFALLPRPGAWMETFKQFMGFSLLWTAAWLFTVLTAQIGGEQAAFFAVFLTMVGFASWIFGRWGGLAASPRDQLLSAAMAFALIAGNAWYWVDLTPFQDDCDDGTLVTDLSFEEEIPWQPFSEERVAAAAGRVVFIDFTADWCQTCIVNEQTVLSQQSVREAMAEHGVIPIKADWTTGDPIITEWLRKYNRAALPVYAVLPRDQGGEPVLLGEVITPSMVIGAIEKAAGT